MIIIDEAKRNIDISVLCLAFQQVNKINLIN
jgi:hypothetical protein